MNWYKKAQEIVTNPHQQGVGYMGVGHTGGYYDNKTHTTKYKEYKRPNIIWMFVNGELRMEEESKDVPTHGVAFPGVEGGSFYGRYEQDSGRLSISIPYGNKMAKIKKEIPNTIMRRLLSAFPKVKQIFIF